jgi:hypothetical protein
VSLLAFDAQRMRAREEVGVGTGARHGHGWLLVGNEALITPEHSAILKAFVDDTAAPLVEPSLP